MDKDKEFKYARMNVIYNDKTFTSIWMELSDDEVFNVIHNISINGTSNMESLKVPLSETRFMVISREQLDNSLIDIELSNRRTKAEPKSKVTMINS